MAYDTWGGSWGSSWGTSWTVESGAGSTVIIFNGIVRAPSQGVSRPMVTITDAGGGTYNVTITAGVGSEEVSEVSYLVDGDPV